MVHGSDGLDEITVTGETAVAEFKDGAVRTFSVSPEDVGLKRHPKGSLQGSDAAGNAAALRRVLAGDAGPYRDAVLMNAGAGLVVADVAKDLVEGARKAASAIDSGEAKSRLERLVAVSNG